MKMSICSRDRKSGRIVLWNPEMRGLADSPSTLSCPCLSPVLDGAETDFGGFIEVRWYYHRSGQNLCRGMIHSSFPKFFKRIYPSGISRLAIL